MKNLGRKFLAVFLGGMWFSMLISVFANQISVTTDFNTATQYLKRIVITDANWNDRIDINQWNINMTWDISTNGDISADKFCSPNWCANIKDDVLDKFSALEWKVETKTLMLTEHFDYNYLPAWMTCNVDHEWELIYAYSDSNMDNWYLYLCKRVPNMASPHYERRKVNLSE